MCSERATAHTLYTQLYSINNFHETICEQKPTPENIPLFELVCAQPPTDRHTIALNCCDFLFVAGKWLGIHVFRSDGNLVGWKQETTIFHLYGLACHQRIVLQKKSKAVYNGSMFIDAAHAMMALRN